MTSKWEDIDPNTFAYRVPLGIDDLVAEMVLHYTPSSEGESFVEIVLVDSDGGVDLSITNTHTFAAPSLKEAQQQAVKVLTALTQKCGRFFDRVNSSLAQHNLKR